MWLRKVTGLLWVGGLVFLAPATWAGEVFSVDLAVSLALQNNPRLFEVNQLVQAAKTKPSQAMALADPMVSLNVQNLPTDSFERDQEAMTQLQLGISQKLPWPGKRAARTDIARSGIAMRESELAEVRQKLIGDVTKAWWQLYFIDRSLDAVRDNQVQLRQLVKVAQSKYRVGEGQQQDVLQAQVELSEMLTQEMKLKGKRRAAVSRLNALMYRDSAQPILLTELDQPLPGDIAEQGQLLQQALASRPLLAVRKNAVEQAQHQLRLAKKERYPDFTLRATYGARDGNNPDGSSRTDLLSVGVSINVPIFAARKQDKAVEQRRHELESKRYALIDSQLQVREQLERALADFDQAREQADLFSSGIIPQTQQTLDSMRVGYRVNKVAFANLIRTQIQLNKFRTAYWRAITDARQAEAEIHAVIGKEI